MAKLPGGKWDAYAYIYIPSPTFAPVTMIVLPAKDVVGTGIVPKS